MNQASLKQKGRMFHFSRKYAIVVSMQRPLRHTKIIATIGPASSDPRVLERMIASGMNVARINFSHGDHATHEAEIRAVRAAAERSGVPVAVIQDLCGPKIRIGDFTDGQITLKQGARFTLTTKNVPGTEAQVSLNYKKLPRDVHKGMHILLDDGKCALEVLSVSRDGIHTRVLRGGHIRSRRGLNVPGATLSIPVLTSKDTEDLAFGLAHGVDFVALSFVQTEKDVLDLRRRIMAAGSTAGVIAKIETRSALEHIDAIVAVARGIMVARGDLAVEIPKENVPIAQKSIIRAANISGRAVITATQMLDSMTTHPTPTRAEVNDVANAIFDGTDAVMLSQETAIGENPAHVIDTMAGIAAHAEASILYREAMERRTLPLSGTVDAISGAVARIATTVGAKAIVALTESGFTPRMVARHRPAAPIIALSPEATTVRQLALSFGCIPIDHRTFRHTTDAIVATRKLLVARKIARKGDRFILVAGIPFGCRGGTNTVTVQDV